MVGVTRVKKSHSRFWAHCVRIMYASFSRDDFNAKARRRRSRDEDRESRRSRTGCMVGSWHFRSVLFSFDSQLRKTRHEFHECGQRERNMTSLAFLESERACTLEACDTADWEICATTKVQGLRV